MEITLTLARTKPVSKRPSFGSQPNNRRISPRSCAILCAIASACALCAYFSGCASRRPIAGRQPPPAQPVNTPSGTAESAKRATDVPETPANPPAVAPTSKRDRPVTPPPVGYTEEGNASWYGEPFHGRRASNGEIYDMYKFTAAHRTLPFDSMVRVTNLNNGKSTTVRITDRGPFVENRVIDLSLAAAREIDLVGPGTAPVRLEVLGGVDPTAGFFTVQVGAFRERGNAEPVEAKAEKTEKTEKAEKKEKK